MAVHLDQLLAEVIACPADQGTLDVGLPADPEADALTCRSCGRSFPVRDGIPVLLLDEVLTDEEPAPGDGDRAPATPAPDDDEAGLP